MSGLAGAINQAQAATSQKVERQLIEHLRREGIPPADDLGWILALREQFPLNDVQFERAVQEARKPI